MSNNVCQSCGMIMEENEQERNCFLFFQHWKDGKSQIDLKEDENYNCIVDKPLFILVLFIKCISFKYTRKLKNSNEITISFDGGKIMDLKNIVALNLVELTGIYGVCFRC